MELRVLETADHSHTLYNTELDETYHSVHGALQESEHVFIQNGLLPMMDGRKKLKIFEMGFGTGLNAILTLKATNNSETTIEYSAIEKYPVSSEKIHELNYDNFLEDPEHRLLYKIMHKIAWEEKLKVAPWFYLQKIRGDLHQYEPNENFDLIYYDAFAPRKQPDLWGLPIVKKLYHMLENDGVLVTYCAKGQFKRDLREAGFEVVPLPGPKGKREMTKAIKRKSFS